MAKHNGKLVSLSADLTGVQRGTNDDLSGSLLFGDATNSFSGTASGGNDTLLGIASSPSDFVAIYGDAFSMLDSTKGGNDLIFGANFSSAGVNDLFGDARYVFDNARGGNDYLKGGDFGNINNIFGDAWSLNGKGGNDVLVGGIYGGVDIMYGDAQTISAGASGGNDTISGGTGTTSTLFGDSEYLYGKGGADVLTGANYTSENIMYGEAYRMFSGAVGGDDMLQAGNNNAVNTLFGDARFVSGNITCGNDVLISGNSVDHMWGDTQEITNGQQISGSDRFVFAPGNNNDVIHDFETGKDIIDLSAFGFASLQDVQTTYNPAGDLQMQFAGGGSITLIGVAQLQFEHHVLI